MFDVVQLARAAVGAAVRAAGEAAGSLGAPSGLAGPGFGEVPAAGGFTSASFVTLGVSIAGTVAAVVPDELDAGRVASRITSSSIPSGVAPSCTSASGAFCSGGGGQAAT